MKTEPPQRRPGRRGAAARLRLAPFRPYLPPCRMVVERCGTTAVALGLEHPLSGPQTGDRMAVLVCGGSRRRRRFKRLRRRENAPFEAECVSAGSTSGSIGVVGKSEPQLQGWHVGCPRVRSDIHGLPPATCARMLAHACHRRSWVDCQITSSSNGDEHESYLHCNPCNRVSGRCATIAAAADPDPVIGTWQLNVAKSVKPARRSRVR